MAKAPHEGLQEVKKDPEKLHQLRTKITKDRVNMVALATSKPEQYLSEIIRDADVLSTAVKKS